jgi:hypothetical protein
MPSWIEDSLEPLNMFVFTKDENRGDRRSRCCTNHYELQNDITREVAQSLIRLYNGPQLVLNIAKPLTILFRRPVVRLYGGCVVDLLLASTVRYRRETSVLGFVKVCRDMLLLEDGGRNCMAFSCFIIRYRGARAV